MARRPPPLLDMSIGKDDQFDNMERQFFRQVQNDHKKACKQLFLNLKRVMQNPVMQKPVATNFF